MKYKILGCMALALSALMLHAQTIPQLKTWLAAGKPTLFNSQPFANAVLNKKEAEEAAQLLLNDAYIGLRNELQTQWDNKALLHDNDTLKFEYKIFGEQPADGRSLFISMHGGGNAAPRVNDQQWRNQIRLYNPDEGVYVAPRAPTNTWNLWHESHIDTLFDMLIHAAVLFQHVNPDKVYLMGYSAGGDGVYQLAPRMADYWAAAAMMAGHPNETSPLGLRNIGFTLHVGGVDSAYNRNKIAQRWSVMLDSLQSADPGGYNHFVQLHDKRPHWMNREDTVAIPWMMKFKRNTIPAKIVWKQDDVIHDNFYWLAIPAGQAQAGDEIIVSYKGNEINIEKNQKDTLVIRLNDKMMNLDKPVVVKQNGKIIFNGKVKRKLDVIRQTIETRKDPALIFSAQLIIANGQVKS